MDEQAGRAHARKVDVLDSLHKFFHPEYEMELKGKGVPASMDLEFMVKATVPIPTGRFRPPPKARIDELELSIQHFRTRVQQMSLGLFPLILPPDRQYDLTFSPGGA